MRVERSAPDAFSTTDITNGERLAWTTQGLILYVRGSLYPFWNELRAAIDLVLASAIASGFTAFQYSHEIGWRPFNPHTRDTLRAEICAALGRRSFWHFKIADRVDFPDLSFEFMDLHLTLGYERASFIRLRLPLGSDPAVLLDLTRKLANTVPFWFGTAGYQFSFAETGREAAFDQLWAWARRHWGVEIVHTRTGTWDVLKGVPGINWITLLGDAFIAEHLHASEPKAGAGTAVETWRTVYGLALQAGPAPTQGDINYFQDVSAYVDASQLLAPAFVEKPLPFPGMFADHKSTSAWIRRFLEPNKWFEPDTI